MFIDPLNNHLIKVLNIEVLDVPKFEENRSSFNVSDYSRARIYEYYNVN